MTFLGDVVLLVAWAVICLSMLVIGVRELLHVLRHRTGRREASVVVATAILGGAALLATVPWAAARLAENAAGWVDADHNGMLDPTANGAYDWSDINAGYWFWYMLLLGGLTLALASSVLVIHRQRVRRDREDELVGLVSGGRRTAR